MMEKNIKTNTYICITESFCYAEEITQHCKSTMKLKVRVAQFVPLFGNSWAIQSMEFSRPEYWSGMPFPSPGDLPNPGIELVSLVPPVLQADFLLLSHWDCLKFTKQEYKTERTAELNGIGSVSKL